MIAIVGNGLSLIKATLYAGPVWHARPLVVASLFDRVRFRRFGFTAGQYDRPALSGRRD